MCLACIIQHKIGIFLSCVALYLAARVMDSEGWGWNGHSMSFNAFSNTSKNCLCDCLCLFVVHVPLYLCSAVNLGTTKSREERNVM